MRIKEFKSKDFKFKEIVYINFFSIFFISLLFDFFSFFFFLFLCQGLFTKKSMLHWYICTVMQLLQTAPCTGWRHRRTGALLSWSMHSPEKRWKLVKKVYTCKGNAARTCHGPQQRKKGTACWLVNATPTQRERFGSHFRAMPAPPSKASQPSQLIVCSLLWCRGACGGELALCATLG